MLALLVLRLVADERHEVRVEVTAQQRLARRDRQDGREHLGAELGLEHLQVKQQRPQSQLPWFNLPSPPSLIQTRPARMQLEGLDSISMDFGHPGGRLNAPSEEPHHTQ